MLIYLLSLCRFATFRGLKALNKQTHFSDWQRKIAIKRYHSPFLMLHLIKGHKGEHLYLRFF